MRWAVQQETPFAIEAAVLESTNGSGVKQCMDEIIGKIHEMVKNSPLEKHLILVKPFPDSLKNDVKGWITINKELLLGVLSDKRTKYMRKFWFLRKKLRLASYQKIKYPAKIIKSTKPRIPYCSEIFVTPVEEAEGFEIGICFRNTKGKTVMPPAELRKAIEIEYKQHQKFLKKPPKGKNIYGIYIKFEKYELDTHAWECFTRRKPVKKKCKLSVLWNFNEINYKRHHSAYYFKYYCEDLAEYGPNYLTPLVWRYIEVNPIN